jgi:hypothetical protein
MVIQILRMFFSGLTLLICQLPLAWCADNENSVEVFGWIEPVLLVDTDFQLEAKLDTGADSSSLGATHIRRVRVGKKRYVRYSVRNPETDELLSIRSPYIRTTRIRSHSGSSQRRRVVEMTVCLGNQQRTVEVNLVDRNEFDYPMLLGRSALQGIAIVDPSITHLSQPDCRQDDG